MFNETPIRKGGKEMKKYFVVADVHGFYDEMITALNNVGYDRNNPDHIFVSLGDAFDRGNQANEVLDFLTQTPEDRRIFILGNHELLMDEALHRRSFLYHDMTNGTKSTAYQIGEAFYDEDACINMLNDWRWKEYFNSCVFYAEVGDNIFVHGWIPCDIHPGYYGERYIYNPGWKDAPISEWKEATWRNGMEAWNNGVKIPGKTIWCGHWHTSWGHQMLHRDGVQFLSKASDWEKELYGNYEKFTPFEDDGICAMDACTVYSHIVNCKIIEVNSL